MASVGIELNILKACYHERRKVAGSSVKCCQEVGALCPKHDRLIGDGHHEVEDEVDRY